MVLNLVGNAVKFTSAGSVSVRAVFQPDPGGETGMLIIRVADTGPGISPESRKKIFDPFVQGESTRGTHSYEGSGLGLAISQRLVNRMGGEIRLEMMGGEFCGNALRCAGFYQALRNGEQGKSCVLAEISGADGVQPVMADTAEGTASTVMPLPLSVQPAGWADVQAARVTFAGITHFVIDCAQPDETLVQRAIAAAPEASAVGAIFLDRACGSIKPVVFVRETASCVAENSCASGSVATAVVLTADFADGITEIGIGQPGGTLEVGVQRTDGAVTGLSIGGAVRLTQTLTVTLPGPVDAPC